MNITVKHQKNMDTILQYANIYTKMSVVKILYGHVILLENTI